MPRVGLLLAPVAGIPAGSYVYVPDTPGAGATTPPATTTPGVGVNLMASRSAAIESGDLAAAAQTHGPNARLSSDSTWAAPGKTRSLRIDLTGNGSESGAQFYFDNGIVPGHAYRVVVIGNRPAGVSGLYNDVYVTVKWRNSAGLVYEYQGGAIDSGSSATTTSSFTAVAPPGATTAGIIVRYAGGSPQGSAFRVGDIAMTELASYVNPTAQYELGFAKPRANLFAPSNIWNMRADTATALHPNSAAMIATLVRDDLGISSPVFNLLQYASSTYVVSRDHPRVNLGFNDAQRKGYTPSGELYTTEKSFISVPVPFDAVSGGGGDGHTTILVPETGEAFDFWQFYKDRWITLEAGGVTPSKANATPPDFSFRTAEQIAAAGDSWAGYSATWGGKITDLPTNIGVFPGQTGASATGIAAFGGTVGIEEVKAGVIDHALYMSIVYPQKFTTYSWPAKRSDGYVDSPNNLPEGLRVRLDPALNLASLNLSPLGRMMAVALQKYGAIIGDKTGAVEFEGESPRTYMARGLANPWDPILAASPNIYQNFPWSQLQALPMDYGKP